MINHSKHIEIINQTSFHEAILGGGCFWCTEAIFQNISGVEKVISGYCGGELENPSYKQICEGKTGHAEVIKITFDSSKISFLQLLKVFFETHDLTTLNRQGNDIGTQYRSVVFPIDDEQYALTKKVIDSLNVSGIYKNKIVTTLEEFTVFYPAENYHQNYFSNNRTEAYCSFLIQPKVEKFENNFKHLIKSK